LLQDKGRGKATDRLAATFFCARWEGEISRQGAKAQRRKRKEEKIEERRAGS
jgi:hypothetical protein